MSRAFPKTQAILGVSERWSAVREVNEAEVNDFPDEVRDPLRYFSEHDLATIAQEEAVIFIGDTLASGPAVQTETLRSFGGLSWSQDHGIVIGTQ